MKIDITNTNEFHIYIRGFLAKQHPESSKDKLKILEDFAVECFVMGSNMTGGKLSVEI